MGGRRSTTEAAKDRPHISRSEGGIELNHTADELRTAAGDDDSTTQHVLGWSTYAINRIKQDSFHRCTRNHVVHTGELVSAIVVVSNVVLVGAQLSSHCSIG